MFNIKATLAPDHERYDGVRPIQIFAMRVGYVLVFVTVGNVAWSRILQHEGGWEPLVAAAVSMWAGSSVLSVLGLIHPLKWLPIVLFGRACRSIWLVSVAYPLWSSDQLAGAPAGGLACVLLWVVARIVAIPWGYVLRTYVLPSRVARRGI